MIRDFTSYNIWKPFCSYCVMLNTFTCRPGNRDVSNNNIQWSFMSHFWYLRKYPHFVQVIIQLFPTVTFISASIRFVIFSSLVTICYMALWSSDKKILSDLLLDPFVMNIFCMTSSMIFPTPFLPFYSYNNPFLSNFSCGNICIYLCCFRHFCCSLNFLPYLSYNSLSLGVLPCFISYSLVRFQARLHLIYFQIIFICDFTSCAGTRVLGFYVKYFLSYPGFFI